MKKKKVYSLINWLSLILTVLILVNCSTSINGVYRSEKMLRLYYAALASNYFKFDNKTKRFYFVQGTEGRVRRSEGTFRISGRILILNSDTNTNSLPLSIQETPCITGDSISVFWKLNNECGIKLSNLYSFKLLINDYIEAKLPQTDTFLIKLDKNVISIQLELSLKNCYDNYLLNCNMFSRRIYVNGKLNNLTITYNHKCGLFTYESFNNDTIKIINWDKIILMKYSTTYYNTSRFRHFRTKIRNANK